MSNALDRLFILDSQGSDLQHKDGQSPDHVAVDETVIRLDDEQYWLYAAVDLESSELLHRKLKPTRTSVLAHAFFHELREKHGVVDVMFLIDGTTPLKDVCNQQGLDFRYEHAGNRNSVECIVHKVKN